MKEALAAVLTGFQSLACDEVRERPVDRLAALGSAQNAGALDNQRRAVDEQVKASDEAMYLSSLTSLGVDLFAWKNGHRELSCAPACERLASHLFSKKILKLSVRQSRRIAWWAMVEWNREACLSCTGSGIHIDSFGVKRDCLVCHGSGKRKFEDEERVEATGERFNRAMFEAHALIGLAESLAVRMARERCRGGLTP